MTVTQNEDKTLLEFSNVISYLVKCRFPDLDLIELDIRDYGQKQAEVNAFIKELNGYSLKELLPQYYNERQKEELLLASLSIRDDELRFFNQPNVRADFWHYCKMLTWTKEQAVALSFGKDPKKVNWTILEEYQDCPPLNELPSKSHFIKCYEKIRELVLSDQELNETASPKTFLDWFNRQEIQVQPELQRMAISLGIIDAAQYDWIKNILDLNSNTNVACRLSFEVCFPNFPSNPNLSTEAIGQCLKELINKSTQSPTIAEAWSFMSGWKSKTYQIVPKSNDPKVLTIEGSHTTHRNFKRKFKRWQKRPS